MSTSLSFEWTGYSRMADIMKKTLNITIVNNGNGNFTAIDPSSSNQIGKGKSELDAINDLSKKIKLNLN